MFFKKISLSLLIFPLLWLNPLLVKKASGIIPFYSIPYGKELEKEGLSIGRSAYQLLYFGQLEEALNLAKLAISINSKNEKLWAILAEAQIANNLKTEALESLNIGKQINPKMSELYFAESTIHVSEKNYKKAKKAILKGIRLEPENTTAIFQLGNIYLMESNYIEAINSFNEAIRYKKDFWQAINNIGLAYFELNETELSQKYFEDAIKFEINAEPMLGLAASIQKNNRKKAIELVKKALLQEPKYVSNAYRTEQLWGKKIQKATNELFNFKELQDDINLAKQYLN